MTKPRLLVIKLGALGDFVYALGAMQGIRQHHNHAHITLLTRRAYEELGTRSGLFEDIWIDNEPKIWQLTELFNLRRRLKAGNFSRIYDLQTSDRTGFYFRLLGPEKRPEWSGIATNCSHCHSYKRPTLIHTVDRQAEQLRIAGIKEIPNSNLTFMNDDISRFKLPRPFVLLFPGSSRAMTIKRWAAEAYAELAKQIATKNLTPVLIGGPSESEAIKLITTRCPNAISLEGQTSIFEISELSRHAAGCVGNDTGPMHLAALSGCPTVAIFSSASFPDKAAPRGKNVTVIVNDPLSDLEVATVSNALLNQIGEAIN